MLGRGQPGVLSARGQTLHGETSGCRERAARCARDADDGVQTFCAMSKTHETCVGQQVEVACRLGPVLSLSLSCPVRVYVLALMCETGARRRGQTEPNAVRGTTTAEHINKPTGIRDASATPAGGGAPTQHAHGHAGRAIGCRMAWHLALPSLGTRTSRVLSVLYFKKTASECSSFRAFHTRSACLRLIARWAAASVRRARRARRREARRRASPPCRHGRPCEASARRRGDGRMVRG